MGAWFQLEVGQGGYGEADTMGRGGVVKKARTNSYVGIQYGLRRNSMELDKKRLNHLLNVKDDGNGVLALLPSSSPLSQSPRKPCCGASAQRGVACCLVV